LFLLIETHYVSLVDAVGEILYIYKDEDVDDVALLKVRVLAHVADIVVSPDNYAVVLSNIGLGLEQNANVILNR